MPGGTSRVVKVTGVVAPTNLPKHSAFGNTITLLVRGSNSLVIEEADRSLHDALCVMRSLIKKRFMICGGGAPETELGLRLGVYAKEQTGMAGYCISAFAEALEIIPYTLAENAGLNPIDLVTELRTRHAKGDMSAGIDIKKNCISEMYGIGVVQPMLVSSSALNLATETICMILKIDDVVVVA